MRNLLSAGFARLKMSKIFIITILVMFVLQTMSVYTNYHDMKLYLGYTCSLDELFFNYTIYLGIAIAVFCSLFLGTEYSDGTIRNKLIIGHSRISIYFSNLIICSVGAAVIGIAGILPSLLIGIPLFGILEMELSTAVVLILCSFVIAIAYTSLFTLAAMLIHSKAIIAVVTILSATILLVVSSSIYSSLTQPEFWEAYTYTAEDGKVITQDAQPNPFYVQGAKREFYEFLMDFLPSGQTSEILMMTISPVHTLIYDTIILLLTTGAGIVCFRKKNIK